MLYPQGGVQPLVSTLNYVGGETVANAAIVPLGFGGLTVVAGVSGTDLVLDVDGYFTDSLVHAVPLNNLFVGIGAGNPATTGSSNTAVGALALFVNDTGIRNTAVGNQALFIGTGNSNTAIGTISLANNTTGSNNTAVGDSALFSNATGNNNIAIGVGAGSVPTAGSGNIHVGHIGLSNDSDTIRIGNTQSRAFIKGIKGITTDLGGAVPVLVDNNGQLGTASSSRRMKTDIEAIGERSRGLHTLNPVSFRYRVHPSDGPVEYGLIAEEVAEVYPELVVRDAEGAPETVRYHLLPALLLSELQRLAGAAAGSDVELRTELQTARAELAELKGTVTELVAEVARLKGRLPVAVERRDAIR